MGWRKRIDLLTFVLLQYILPAAAIPDLIMGVIRHRLPLYGPLTALLFLLAFLGMLKGSISTLENKQLNFSHLLTIFAKNLVGIVYMLHWQVVMPSITARMSVRPKRLKWVKTVHAGAAREKFEF
jgi:1,2-diacylglycerol 3-beta-glucosyltransferase